MNHLNYPKKLMMIATIFFLPLIAVLIFTLHSSCEQFELIQKEKQGLRYLQNIQSILMLIPEHRGMTKGYLHGELSFKDDILNRQRAIKKALESFDQIIAEEGIAFWDSSKWLLIKQQWLTLQKQTFAPAVVAGEYFKTHNLLVSEIIGLMAQIAEEYQLDLDPDRESNHLLRMIATEIPQLVEYSGQARGMGCGVAASKQLSIQERQALVALYGLIASGLKSTANHSLFHQTHGGMNFCSCIQDSTLLTNSFLDSLNREILTADVISVDPVQFFDFGTRAINANFALFEGAVERVNTLLDNRKRRIYREMAVQLSFMLGGLLSVAYLFAGFYASIITPINCLESAARDIAMGKLDRKVKFANRDEMALVASSFNDMTDNLSEMISKLEDSKEELSQQLYTDSLTGMGNRFRLKEHIQNITTPTLVLVNIDSFKEVNDFYGNDVGDELIIAVGKRLGEIAAGRGFSTYKMAADEYALLIDKVFEQDALTSVLQTISSELNENRFMVHGWEFNIAVTMGQACFPLADKIDLLSAADVALKTAKKNSIPFAFFYEVSQVRREYEENIKWVQAIRQAIAENKVVPFFQPIIRNSDEKIHKYECLMRILDKENKPITPWSFLEVAKKSRLYPQLTRIIVGKSFSYFQNKEDEFSLNLSVEDILDRETMDYIFERLATTGIGSRVVFEIVESEGIENFDEVIEFIRHVKSFGCKIAIDDFGTGYSNFAYILKLDVDFLKIDASLIKNIATDPDSLAIVETIVDFAKKMGVKTIAEFVHSPEVYSVEKSVGIDFSQGYFFGKPQADVLLSVS